MTDASVRVAGQPTAEEVAAVLAVLTREPSAPDRYTQWRRTRRAALLRTTARLGDVSPT